MMDTYKETEKEIVIANGAFERCVTFMAQMLEKYADSVYIEKVEKTKQVN